MNAQAPPFLMTTRSSPPPPPTTTTTTTTTTPSPSPSPPNPSTPPSPTSSSPPPSQTPTTPAAPLLPDDTSLQKQPQIVRILRREHKRPNNNNRPTPPSDTGENMDPSDQRRNMTIEERELAYGLARARIFAEEAATEPPRSNSSSPKPNVEKTRGENKPEASPSSSPSSSNSASASSSTAGPSKAAINGKPKQKNTSTQPNGDAATSRAPRVTHKPKPQYRPPASANFATSSTQMFGYPGFVPPPDAYAEQQQVRAQYASSPLNVYQTPTPFGGRPPPPSVMYSQNNPMPYSNGNFLMPGMPGVPHVAAPFYPMDGHPNPYLPDSQLMSGPVGYSGNGPFYHPMQSMQQTYPPLLQYPNVAPANGPPYRPVVPVGYDWASSSLNPISPYGPPPGNPGGMTGMTVRTPMRPQRWRPDPKEKGMDGWIEDSSR